MPIAHKKFTRLFLCQFNKAYLILQYKGDKKIQISSSWLRRHIYQVYIMSWYYLHVISPIRSCSLVICSPHSCPNHSQRPSGLLQKDLNRFVCIHFGSLTTVIELSKKSDQAIYFLFLPWLPLPEASALNNLL